ncbi:MAG TPA: hypothetical protein VHJ83_09310, partial [Micromonosporaceae bacterium]|nr:hypothetical protein [Micromonosporaceae bacterium]
GLGTIVQLDPSHLMIRVRLAGLAPETSALPTAHASVPLSVFTPLRLALMAPAGFGLGTTVQVLPFQRSVSGDDVDDWVEPTAHTFVVVLPSTATSVASSPTAGVATSDQALPFHLAARGRTNGAVAWSADPTAQALVELRAATPLNRLGFDVAFGVATVVQVAANAGVADRITAVTATTTVDRDAADVRTEDRFMRTPLGRHIRRSVKLSDVPPLSSTSSRPLTTYSPYGVAATVVGAGSGHGSTWRPRAR